jgi:carboxynorspermidine decarboxylase
MLAIMDERVSSFLSLPLETPAFVLDELKLKESIEALNNIRQLTGFKILFAVKSSTLSFALEQMIPHIEGFSTSSVFETMIARSIAGIQKSVHFTKPAITASEIDVVAELCDFLSFNSFTQWERYHQTAKGKTSCGLRINPQLSFVDDERYNPSRKYSKLGVSLYDLDKMVKYNPGSLQSLRGLHFHNNCESYDFHDLVLSIYKTESVFKPIINRIDWINVGGGYLFEYCTNLDRMAEAVDLIQKKYGLIMFFEPGKGVIGKAGYIIASVVDVIKSDGRLVAILDTTVNHMPEVFEYQYRPVVSQSDDTGKYSYILSGATCLAGDIFGEYFFDEPLEIGSRIAFEDMGAYTLVKANMFNGINLPTIYAYTQNGKLEMKRQFTYDDFLSRCGSR